MSKLRGDRAAARVASLPAGWRPLRIWDSDTVHDWFVELVTDLDHPT
ncbi:hypothetical protein [Streptomyces sp. NPDC051098]